MSDTEAPATAPSVPLSSADRMRDAVARYAASTAPEATRAAPASPEPVVTAAATGESDPTIGLNTAEATQDFETDGEALTEEAPAFPPADSVVFVADDGTPVTVEEARKGYLRQSQFTQKTQALAEQARIYAEREGVIAQARDMYVARLQEAEQLLASRVPAEPDPALKFGTPEQRQEYILAWQERQDALTRLAIAHEEKNRLLREQSEAQSRKQAEYQQAQAAMILERLADWRDPNVAAREKAAIRDYARKLDFSSDEIERVFDGRADHRLAAILRDAVVGRKVREGGAKGKSTRPVTQPAMPQPTRAEVRSAPPVSNVERDLRAARDQLGSGSRSQRLAAAAQILAGSQGEVARPR